MLIMPSEIVGKFDEHWYSKYRNLYDTLEGEECDKLLKEFDAFYEHQKQHEFKWLPSIDIDDIGEDNYNFYSLNILDPQLQMKKM